MKLDTQLNRNKAYRADIEGMRAIAILLVIWLFAFKVLAANSECNT